MLTSLSTTAQMDVIGPKVTPVTGLTGKLPPAAVLLGLPALKWFDIDSQPNITGPLPDYSALTKLERMDVSANALTGTLPAALAGMKGERLTCLFCGDVISLRVTILPHNKSVASVKRVWSKCCSSVQHIPQLVGSGGLSVKAAGQIALLARRSISCTPVELALCVSIQCTGCHPVLNAQKVTPHATVCGTLSCQELHTFTPPCKTPRYSDSFPDRGHFNTSCCSCFCPFLLLRPQCAAPTQA